MIWHYRMTQTKRTYTDGSIEWIVTIHIKFIGLWIKIKSLTFISKLESDKYLELRSMSAIKTVENKYL